ncbi:MAG: tetratricopeptide repeat protein [Candidatus Pacebacteria bacterium]|nr:tetratricopeptide repeat protein [Candidatus Paceibacterota bacterium]
METIINLSKPSSLLKRISFIIGIALSILLPIFIAPTSLISFWAGKNIIIILGVILLFLGWAFDRIKNKNLFISKNILVISAYLVPIAYLLSAIFSGSIMTGLLGDYFEVSSFITIAALFMLMFFISKSFKTKQQVLYFYAGLILSAAIMAIFHLFRLFLGPEFLSFNVLNSATSNLIGNWNELGIFFGLIVILNLIINEYLGKNKIIKISSIVLIIISLFFICLVNFSLIWIFLMISSLFLIVYNLFITKFNYKNLYKKPSIYVFVITLIFVLFQGKIGGVLPDMFGISNAEISPTISSTLSIAKSTLMKDPILGAGPNKFAQEWITYKPQGINLTEFWNTDFNTGNSFIFSSLVTVGLLGFISWILFLISVIYLGFKLIKTSQDNEFNHFTAISLFTSALYLILFLIFYVPGTVILGITFLIFGILLSSLNQKNIVRISEVSFRSSKIKNVVFTLVIIALLGSTVFGGFMFSKKVLASSQFNRALTEININQDFNKAYELTIAAATTYPSDFYFRNLTDLNLMQLQNVLNQEAVDEETLQEQFQAAFSATVGSAQRAIQLDTNNYLNWVTLAKIYGSVIPLQIEGAYDGSLQSYMEAIRLNPSNPLLVLNLANLELANGDLEKAKEYIGIAIQMKNNYSDAYYLLSQLEFNEGNKEIGLQIIEALASVTPNDPEVFLQLGALNYEDTDYERAQAFLERAVTLNPYYSNAKYLLGLTYNVIGEKDKALGQFSDLKILNPNDENIQIILNNIEDGRDPFYGFEQQSQTAPPVDTTGEVIPETTPENAVINE